MGEIKDAFASAFRDYATEGIPASGEHEPNKAEIRAIGDKVEAAISAVTSDIQRYATVADMQAITDAEAGQLAQVYANNGDPADPANGVYQWDAGTSAWVLAPWYFDAVAGVVQPLVDDAQAWAEGTEPGGAGTKSAKEWAADAAAGATARNRILAMDYASDSTSPLFIWTPEFVRSHLTPASFAEATIVSRGSDTQFTVASGHGNRFAKDVAFVLKDDATGHYESFVVKSVSSDTITIYGGPLPTSISVAQTMHDAALGQHLSRLGYKGLADFVVDASERYAYKKAGPLFAYNPALASSLSYNTYNIRNYANTEDMWAVTRLGTASGGGLVSGTTNLTKTASNATSDENPGLAGAAYLFSRSYRITDSTAGSGVSVDFDAQGYAGFVEIPVAARATGYTLSGGGSAVTDGRVRVKVLADGVGIFDEIYPVGLVSFARVDFPACVTLTVQVMTADATISDIRWYGAFGYAKSPRTPDASIFENDDVIAVYMDSWGEFPNPSGGEVPPLRADGSTAGGMQFFSSRLAERLAGDGVRATVLNMSRGGQTSAWARYWAPTILKLNPRPTKVILNFAINDFNSNGNVAGHTSSVYDFDPDDMWASKLASAGGVFGSVTFAQWYANMEWLCDFFARNGVQPIVLTPAVTASVAQSYNLARYGTNRIAAGFEPIYDEAGRTP